MAGRPTEPDKPRRRVTAHEIADEYGLQVIEVIKMVEAGQLPTEPTSTGEIMLDPDAVAASLGRRVRGEFDD